MGHELIVISRQVIKNPLAFPLQIYVRYIQTTNIMYSEEGDTVKHTFLIQKTHGWYLTKS